MKTFLDDLWYSYQAENPITQSLKKKTLLEMLISNEGKLYSDLSEEQKQTLKQYDSCLNDISSISEKEAFVKGLRFATTFLIETLYANKP